MVPVRIMQIQRVKIDMILDSEWDFQLVKMCLRPGEILPVHPKSNMIDPDRPRVVIIRIAFWREDGDTLVARHHHDRVRRPFRYGDPFQPEDVHIPTGTAFRIGGPDGDMVNVLELDQCF